MKFSTFWPSVSLLAQLGNAACSAQSTPNVACSPDSFSFPSLFGAELISFSANSEVDYKVASLVPGSSAAGVVTANFCNVTVTYTHPGWNDTINVQVWLPLANWTGRLQALGGGGYSASFGPLYLATAAAVGDVAIGTDAGHVQGNDVSQSPKTWALSSPGNVNLNLFRDWASRSLHDMAVIGKTVAETYYGSEPTYSYFTGCSGGGRQALMAAQRFPEDFDGILAAAPAINIENFVPAGYWAQQVMKNTATFPPPCEIAAYTQAAIDACDAFDGVEDGVISDPLACTFQAASVVGQTFNCSGTDATFTSVGATVVQAAWDGPIDASGKVGWWGINKDANLSSYAATVCADDGTCSAGSAALFLGWIQYFVAKDPDFNAANLTDADFFRYLSQSEKEYDNEVAAADPDLSLFRAAGGKMITWHGLADEAIPPNGTIAYYQAVLDLDPAAADFFRFFEAPGAAHCFGGAGPTPNTALDQLKAWVEDDTAPETLAAISTTGSTRNLCLFPSVQKYIGGDVTLAASYDCSSPTRGPGDLAETYAFFKS
ncbi:putative feruloyl esterase b precursor protein [Paramyrothecium foliicola]|nr:putative feruloyl esterase b precursor protein [Paramyrothecium foliicola]